MAEEELEAWFEGLGERDEMVFAASGVVNGYGSVAEDVAEKVDAGVERVFLSGGGDLAFKGEGFGFAEGGM
ncbi:MAG: hypothetical protein ACKV19_20300 [Verrucomicrobiales bacterium]